jgi:hypothetical protein
MESMYNMHLPYPLLNHFVRLFQAREQIFFFIFWWRSAEQDGEDVVVRMRMPRFSPPDAVSYSGTLFGVLRWRYWYLLYMKYYIVILAHLYNCIIFFSLYDHMLSIKQMGMPFWRCVYNFLLHWVFLFLYLFRRTVAS